MTPGTVPKDGKPQQGVEAATSWFAETFASAAGIYGLIVVSGLIAVSRNLAGSSVEALFAILGTLFVFFAAHTYAATLSRLAHMELEDRSLRDAVRFGLAESTGLFLVGLVPVAVLSLGVMGLLRPADAVWLALGIDILLLGILGWGVTALRVDSFWARIGGALLTAAFGGILIGLKVLIH